MSNNKQSSVEWLISQIAEDQMIKAKSLNEWTKIFEQAKAMHKEEMEHFFKRGMFLVEGRLWKPIDKFEENYNETYGGDK